MTDFINRHHNQTITYWNMTGRAASGKGTFASAVEITGRWEDRSVAFTDNTGKEVVSSSVVFVNQDVKAGDWLFLGGISAIPSSEDSSNPNKVTGAHEVSGFNKIPTLKANKFLRMTLLRPR